MSNIRIGVSEKDTYALYLYDEEGTLPGPGVFTDAEYAEFNEVRSAWLRWQERLDAAYSVQERKDEQSRREEKERADYERLKAKFET